MILPIINLMANSGITYDSDALTIFSNMTAAGSTPSASFKTVINNLVKNLKGTGTQGSDNIWALLDYLAMFGTETEAQSLVAWKGNNPTKYNSPTYVAKSGWLPNATGSHSLWSNFTPSTNGVNYTQNSCSFGVWLGASPGTSYFMASLSTNKSGVRTVTSNNDNYCNSSTFALAHFSTSTEGLFWINRASSSVFKTIKNDTVISSPSSASSGLPDWKMAIAGYANSSTTISNIPTLTNPVKIAFAGASLESYKTQLYNSFSQYVTEVAAL